MNTSPCMNEESVHVYRASFGPFLSANQSGWSRCPLKIMVGAHVAPLALMVVTTVVFSRELDRIDSTTFCPASAKAFIVFVPCGVVPDYTRERGSKIA